MENSLNDMKNIPTHVMQTEIAEENEEEDSDKAENRVQKNEINTQNFVQVLFNCFLFI